MIKKVLGIGKLRICSFCLKPQYESDIIYLGSKVINGKRSSICQDCITLLNKKPKPKGDNEES